MRARLGLVPIAIAAALIAGCGSTTTPGSQATPSPTTLADNGVAALSATEILDKAKTALAAAKSVHIKGTATSEGTKATIDIRLAGKDFSGTIEAEGSAIEVIRVGNDLYMKAPEAFWKNFVPAGQEAALALLKDKYVKLDATDAQFGSLADIGRADQLLAPEGTVSKGEAKTVNGVLAIGLVDSKDRGVLYIATVGDPLPVRVEGPSGEAVDFSDYGETVQIKAPDASQVLDLKSLMGS